MSSLKDSNSPKVYFKNLDALRFLAFLGVYVTHNLLMLFLKIPALEEQPILKSFIEAFAIGDYAVSFFFVLSGFLITYLLMKEYDRKGKIHIGRFYMRRILRIWPLYFLLLFIGFIAMPFALSMIGGHHVLCSNPLYQILFLGNFDLLRQAYEGYACYNPILFITWSVSIEEQFYLVWPILLILVPRRFWIQAIGGVLLVAIIFRVIHWEDWYFQYLHTSSVMGDLAIGGLCAILSKNEGFKNWITRFENKDRLANYFLGFSILILRNVIFNFNYGVVIERLMIICFFAYVILDQNYHPSTKGKAGNWQKANFWGKYTYGLYMLHPVVTFFLMKVSDKLHLAGLSPIFKVAFVFLGGIPLSFLLAYFIYHLVEERFLILKKHFR